MPPPPISCQPSPGQSTLLHGAPSAASGCPSRARPAWLCLASSAKESAPLLPSWCCKGQPLSPEAPHLKPCWGDQEGTERREGAHTYLCLWWSTGGPCQGRASRGWDFWAQQEGGPSQAPWGGQQGRWGQSREGCRAGAPPAFYGREKRGPALSWFCQSVSLQGLWVAVTGLLSGRHAPPPPPHSSGSSTRLLKCSCQCLSWCPSLLTPGLAEASQGSSLFEAQGLYFQKAKNASAALVSRGRSWGLGVTFLASQNCTVGACERASPACSHWMPHCS